ncbi:MAG: FIST C-terminal domain-containing protein [Candidatus Omnitrophota bacterium]|nr:MAG: FIST C-terminal domain-containing protein [Candidatus Omnitrophota bacterium]
MIEKKFAIALSEKSGEDAAKEISLKIKSVFPRAVKYVIVFFTPHYQAHNIAKTLQFTLNPEGLFGITSPLLIFEGRLIEKGIIAWAINKREARLKGAVLKESPGQLDSWLGNTLKEFKGKKKNLLSLFSGQGQRLQCLKELNSATAQGLDIIGAGYIKKGTATYLQIANAASEGALNIISKGLNINAFRLEGYLPLGKPFVITKILGKSEIIAEINAEPAINIYRHYLQEKFETFKNKRLFLYYPLGIEENGKTRLVSIRDYLEDGSLVCTGTVKEGDSAQILLLHPDSFLESLKKELNAMGKSSEGVAFMINSLIRKKILTPAAAEEELRWVRKYLSEQFLFLGIYADYSFLADKKNKEIEIEAASSLMTLWT